MTGRHERKMEIWPIESQHWYIFFETIKKLLFLVISLILVELYAHILLYIVDFILEIGIDFDRKVKTSSPPWHWIFPRVSKNIFPIIFHWMNNWNRNPKHTTMWLVQFPKLKKLLRKCRKLKIIWSLVIFKKKKLTVSLEFFGGQRGGVL